MPVQVLCTAWSVFKYVYRHHVCCTLGSKRCECSSNTHCVEQIHACLGMAFARIHTNIQADRSLV